jgi:GNAT superfamily N-acetyltransferase
MTMLNRMKPRRSFTTRSGRQSTFPHVRLDLMRLGSELTPASERLLVRRARFDEGAELLRLIEGAVEVGCRTHYSAAQRRAVFLTYAENIFLELVQPVDTLVAVAPDSGASVLGLAQLDPAASRLRGLFVAGGVQGMGIGRALLGAIERLARARGLSFIQGAMSLNATSFYVKAGFHPCSGGDHLIRNGVVVPVVPMEKRLG